jgi:phage host-nuclease inhibitor protein Gam
MLNTYWPTYKSIEREILALAEKVHFDDCQIEVYSMEIANLLCRCAIEIESLSKKLYEIEGGDMAPLDSTGKSRTLYFDTDCIEKIERLWALSKKQVIVTAPSFYFSDKSNTVLAPLNKANKRGDSGADWKKAYQAVKHDRDVNLKKGNVKYLLRAMAALYLLNLYYKNDVFFLGNNGTGNSLNPSMGSDLFSIIIDMQQPNSTYIIRKTDDYEREYAAALKSLNQELRRVQNEKVLQWITAHIDEVMASVAHIADTKEKQKEVGRIIQQNAISSNINQLVREAGTSLVGQPLLQILLNAKYEAVLNKTNPSATRSNDAGDSI